MLVIKRVSDLLDYFVWIMVNIPEFERFPGVPIDRSIIFSNAISGINNVTSDIGEDAVKYLNNETSQISDLLDKGDFVKARLTAQNCAEYIRSKKF